MKQNDALWVGETLLSAKYVGMGSEREVLFFMNVCVILCRIKKDFEESVRLQKCDEKTSQQFDLAVVMFDIAPQHVKR